MIEVDVFGACTVRDAFEFSKILKEKYHVNKFVQNNSPLTLGTSRLEDIGVLISNEKFSLTAPCWYKWFDLNANEKVYEYFNESRGEYLILNLTEMSYSFYEIKSGDLLIRICNQYGITKNDVSRLFPKYSYKNPLELEYNEIEDCISRFVDKITNIYTADKIILIRNYLAELYVNGNDEYLYRFESKNINDINNYLSFVYQSFVKLFKQLKIIEVPVNILGYEKHKWGLASQHYTQEVYDYIGNCIDYVVTSNKKLINDYEINYNLNIKHIDFYNEINKRYKKFKLKNENKELSGVIRTPFYNFCLRYACIRILIMSLDDTNESFIVHGDNLDTMYTPKWVKNCFSKIIISDLGNLSFNLKILRDCNLRFYLQSVDARSGNNQRYVINIKVTEFNIDNEILIDNSKPIIVSHGTPFSYELSAHQNDIRKIQVKWCPKDF